MKILVFTDNHSLNVDILMEKAQSADVVISLGDMSLMGRYLEDQFIFLQSLGKPVLVIPGNHESGAEFKELVKKYPGITNVDRCIHIIEDVVFLGFGGGGFSSVEPEFEDLRTRFADAVKNHTKSFLLTHGPPYDTELDYLANWEPQPHRGVKSYRDFIDDFQPTYALSGHFHETFGMTDTVGKTKLMNPGDEGEIIEV